GDLAFAAAVGVLHGQQGELALQEDAAGLRVLDRLDLRAQGLPAGLALQRPARLAEGGPGLVQLVLPPARQAVEGADAEQGMARGQVLPDGGATARRAECAIDAR